MVTRTVDLRSDTVTKPTEAMRAAMSAAEVDDDVLGTDPTAFRLESEVARMLGKEAGLFVPSGTMSNLISVLVHCDVRGSEVILGDNSHIHIFENGGISTIGGVHPRPVKNNEDGTMDIGLIEAAIRDPRGELVYPTTRLICLENSHGNTGGRCLPVEYIDRVGELAKKHGLKLHIDGARIFNASVALGVPVNRLVQPADSVSVCLSKGLGAPVGSVIVGSKTFIVKARRLRKTLGGGMRQVGFICAAALVALQENLGKLEHDHMNAKALAEGLNQIEGLRVNLAAVETNIIFFNIVEGSKITAAELYKHLVEHGVLVMPEGPSRMRIVLHHQISSSDVQKLTSLALERLREVSPSSSPISAAESPPPKKGSFATMPSGILEITLVSAHDLPSVTKNMKTYAVVWLQHDEDNKQATNVDQAGGINPKWNHAFTFRAGGKFLNSEDAAISVEVCAAAWDKDATIGYVDIPLRDILEMPSSVVTDASGTASFKLHRPKGKSQGVLKIEVSLKLSNKEHSGSIVNGSSLCNSDIGPSASVVAAAIANGLYTPPVNNETPSEESEQIKEWTKKEREKAAAERRPIVGSIVGAPFHNRKVSRARSTKGRKGDGKKLFSCLGCEIAITCGSGGNGGDEGSRRRNRRRHRGSNKVCNLSSVDD
ncbi:hypothetical protein V6N12_023308 [Hibiscus sabdariffa]|uniref:C2 domain-containing protein n=1 Tax=Hibiscus sabdariffa TaxID=183260 RepID=A0ABR2FXC8_9ROSI